MTWRKMMQSGQVAHVIFACLTCIAGFGACGQDRMVVVGYSDASTAGGTDNAGCASDNGPCNLDNDCCSHSCGVTHTCQPQSTCRSEGDPCAVNADCCSDYCPPDTKECPKVSNCFIVGERCTANSECCSGACADPGTGVKTCQAVDGCTPIGDLCSSTSSCCSSTGAVNSSKNQLCYCVASSDCLAAGEICTRDSTSQPCCVGQFGEGQFGAGQFNGFAGGDAGTGVGIGPGIGAGGAGAVDLCQPTSLGVYRCLGHIPFGKCAPDSAPCSVPEDCCNQYCLPSPGGKYPFACQSKCSGPGGPCTASRDCCNENAPPYATCSKGICESTGTSCKPLGLDCTSASDCCSAMCEQVNGSGMRCIVSQ